MINRTAQEWADFIGEDIRRNTKTFDTLDYSVVIDKNFVSDFMNYNFLQTLKPSEPCTLVPDRVLSETAETLERMNKALDEKIEKQGENFWMQKIKDSGLFDLTGSYIEGVVLFCLSPLRNDKTVGSFSINTDSGFWFDHATFESGSFEHLVFLKNMRLKT